MSCVVGAYNARQAVIAGDSRVVYGDMIQTTRDPKVHRAGAWLVGLVGEDSAIIQLESLMSKGIAGDIRLRVWPKWRKVKGEWAALLVQPGRMVTLDPSGTTEHAGNAYAIGSGSPYALGALACGPGKRPLARVRAALEASALHCIDVAPPWCEISLRASA